MRSTKINKPLVEYKTLTDIVLDLMGNCLLRLHPKLREIR